MKLPLRYKFMVPIITAVVITSVISSFYIVEVVKDNYSKTSLTSMQHLADYLAGEVTSITNESISTAITLASSMESLTLENHQIPREALMDMLVKIQKEDNNLYGVWANWLPN